MLLVFAIIALITVAGAVAAVSLRNLVHCVLMLVVAFAGLAALYLQLGAEFVGFAQVLVYIGAVAILIVFAILLTRSSEPEAGWATSVFFISGGVVALVVFALLAGCILASGLLPSPPAIPPEVTVLEIGENLLTRYVLPLQVLGLLLTAALIGAVMIALRERENQ
jgi:NADH-quinone oxidoreductase subunit J